MPEDRAVGAPTPPAPRHTGEDGQRDPRAGGPRRPTRPGRRLRSRLLEGEDDHLLDARLPGPDALALRGAPRHLPAAGALGHPGRPHRGLSRLGAVRAVEAAAAPL